LCTSPCCTAFKASSEGVRSLRAAMHQGDFTIRPQVLTQVANPGYYRLLTEFQRLSGVGAVLNTSFNLHGSPLVATPEQAMATLRNSGLNYLALGPFLVCKKTASTRLRSPGIEAARLDFDPLPRPSALLTN
jgi:carbamoyltransferase